MFRKIRVTFMSMLVLLVLLILTITPALASSASFTPHTISPGSRTTYWSGSGGCNNVSPYGIYMYQRFASYAAVKTGYYTTSGGYVQHAYFRDEIAFVWIKENGPQGLFKFWTKNVGSNTIECTEGTIKWSMDYSD